MNHALLAVAAFAVLSSAPAFAQQAAADYTLTGNLTLASDYRFRGISQTNKKPTLQGGFDFAAGGFYAGNWNSNIDSDLYTGSNLEMDFYGGYKGTAASFGYDVGALYYYYPGSGNTGAGKIDNTELYAAASFGPVTLKYSHAVSDFFNAPDSKNSYYLDLSASHEIGGFVLGAHVGYQKLKGGARVTEIGGAGLRDSIVDYRLGVTRDVSGFVLGAALIGTNRDLAGSVAGRNISGDTLVLSVGKTF